MKQETPVNEKLLRPMEVMALLRLNAKTPHTLRNLEKRGVLFPVRISARLLRWREADVLKLIAGK